jgi:hypothetical protein
VRSPRQRGMALGFLSPNVLLRLNHPNMRCLLQRRPAQHGRAYALYHIAGALISRSSASGCCQTAWCRDYSIFAV